MDDSTFQLRVVRGVLAAHYGNLPVLVIQQRHLRMKCEATVAVRERGHQIIERFGLRTRLSIRNRTDNSSPVSTFRWIAAMLSMEME